jgi:hypothetical protein
MNTQASAPMQRIRLTTIYAYARICRSFSMSPSAQLMLGELRRQKAKGIEHMHCQILKGSDQTDLEMMHYFHLSVRVSRNMRKHTGKNNAMMVLVFE